MGKLLRLPSRNEQDLVLFPALFGTTGIVEGFPDGTLNSSENVDGEIAVGLEFGERQEDEPIICVTTTAAYVFTGLEPINILEATSVMVGLDVISAEQLAGSLMKFVNKARQGPEPRRG